MKGLTVSEFETEAIWGTSDSSWETSISAGSTALMGDYEDDEDDGVYESDEDDVDHGDPNFFDDEDDDLEDDDEDDDEDL